MTHQRNLPNTSRKITNNGKPLLASKPGSPDSQKSNTINNKTSAELLLGWDDLPAWRQDNHYILSAYRQTSYSYRRSFHSLFYLHNESVNIHTHLSAALLFLVISVYFHSTISTYLSLPASASSPSLLLAQRLRPADVTAFSFFFAGAIACLGISATYHMISNHSPVVNQLGNQLDYVGIVALITGSFIPSIYYGFCGERGLQVIYWGMISTLGIACTTVSLAPKFRTPVWRPFRASMFVAMGLSAVVPVLHGLKIYGVAQMNQQIGLLWLVGQGVLYILGAGIYAARIPEKWRPGKFDVWGSSHQIFHVLVVLAAMAHFFGLIKAFQYSKENGICGI
ncbi:MAG: hypothetical protein MMC33_000525 [Icmadophila ericetorum]|nr:hypothetical protein [Icmadophila ericetorum]